MKTIRLFIYLLLIHFSNNALGQQSKLDSIAYNNWQTVEGMKVSDDGRYVQYVIKNQPIGESTLVLQEVMGKWRKEYIGIKRMEITPDSKFSIFIKNNDTLGVLEIGTDSVRYIPRITSFNIHSNKKGHWVSYETANTEKSLTLLNLNTGEQYFYTGVLESWFSNDGYLFVIQTLSISNRNCLELINLNNGRSREVWQGRRASNLVFDLKNHQLAFIVDQKIWCFNYKDDSAYCITDSTQYLKNSKLDDILNFSRDGKRLYFNVKLEKNIQYNHEGVEVWSYNDIQLQTEQETESPSRTCLLSIDVNSHKIIRLKEKPGVILTFPTFMNAQDTIALKREMERKTEPWSIASKTTNKVVFTTTGKELTLGFIKDNYFVQLSSSGKFIIYFDQLERNYFSYEIATQTIRNITKAIDNVSWLNLNLTDDGAIRPRGVACWLKEDKYVLIYDANDIWKIDPTNKQKPVSLTNGYGIKQNIIFSLEGDNYRKKEITENEKIILSAFNVENKTNGFFSKILKELGDPELLTMLPYVFNTNSEYVPWGANFETVKAKDANLFILRRMAPTDAPNYFATKDYKKFTRLSNIQPQKRYNWYTTELHSWASLDGKKLQGILYKPTNFDNTKEYPVIFVYYERKSDGLNAYINPEPLCSGCEIDIPTYVSNGYLIFVPDIFYEVGNPMQGTYNAVVSAADYISKLPFVNSRKLGLQGCSFGGLQTNYLITQTHLFTAACSASGIADLVSAYGGLDGSEGGKQYASKQIFFEGIGNQGRMGGSLWNKRTAYIKNSPVFHADRVITPLLIMHGKKDERFSFYNELEFFMGLRRLGKKVWMLVYPQANHSLTVKNDIYDFSKRMMQFFNHYLMDRPAPMWMLDGVPASKRGIDSGLELDSTGRSPGPGLLKEDHQRTDCSTPRESEDIKFR